MGLVAFGLAKSAGPSKHAIHGTLTLSGSDNFDDGIGCSGNGGYSDLDVGGDVTVADGSHKTIGVGSLGLGSSDGSDCVFSFTVEDVPEVDIYEVWAGNDSRGGPHYTLKDMKENNWTVDLSIGS